MNNEKKELYAQLVSKCWEDSDFKDRLVSDPVNVIQEFTGEALSIPEGKTLVINDQTDTSNVYVNIPPQEILDNMELTDKQLEAVAGGASIPITWEDLVLFYLDPWNNPL